MTGTGRARTPQLTMGCRRIGHWASTGTSVEIKPIVVIYKWEVLWHFSRSETQKLSFGEVKTKFRCFLPCNWHWCNNLKIYPKQYKRYAQPRYLVKQTYIKGVGASLFCGNYECCWPHHPDIYLFPWVSSLWPTPRAGRILVRHTWRRWPWPPCGLPGVQRLPVYWQVPCLCAVTSRRQRGVMLGGSLCLIAMLSLRQGWTGWVGQDGRCVGSSSCMRSPEVAW